MCHIRRSRKSTCFKHLHEGTKEIYKKLVTIDGQQLEFKEHRSQMQGGYASTEYISCILEECGEEKGKLLITDPQLGFGLGKSTQTRCYHNANLFSRPIT
jgi:hypothetical protein